MPFTFCFESINLALVGFLLQARSLALHTLRRLKSFACLHSRRQRGRSFELCLFGEGVGISIDK